MQKFVNLRAGSAWSSLLLIATLCFAATPREARAAVSDEEKQTLQLLINARLDEAVKDLVDEKKIAKLLFLDHPVQQPAKSLEEVDRDVAAEVKTLADTEFAGRDAAYFKREAAELYPLYKVFSTQTVEKLDGTTITEKIRDINPDGIEIGITKLHYDELSANSLVNFNKVLNANKCEAHVRQKLTHLAEDRLAYERKIRPDIERRLKYNAGYMQVEGSWVQKSTFFKSHIERVTNQYRANLLAPVTASIYYENGFVQYNGEWMRLEERNRQMAEAAKAASANDSLFGDTPATPTAAPTAAPAEEPVWGSGK